LLDLQLAQAQEPPKIPEFKAPQPIKYSPPPVASASDQLDAESRARKLALQRQGQHSTLLAPRPGAMGTRTLLG